MMQYPTKMTLARHKPKKEDDDETGKPVYDVPEPLKPLAPGIIDEFEEFGLNRESSTDLKAIKYGYQSKEKLEELRSTYSKTGLANEASQLNISKLKNPRGTRQHSGFKSIDPSVSQYSKDSAEIKL